MVVPFQSSFIRKDIEILSAHYDVVLNEYNWRKKSLTPLFIFLQVFSILRHILSIKYIIVEFGGYWSLMPSVIGKIFNVPALIVLHGTDCAMMPHINYGNLRKKPLKMASKWSYKYASMLLPVSSSLLKTKNDYNEQDIMQGVNYHFPRLKTPARVINNGLSPDFWTPSDLNSKESKTFIAVFSQSQFKLKGGDLIHSLAGKFPECKFLIAGSGKPAHLAIIPDNVHFLGMIDPVELREHYRKARFHLQLSMFEGFGLALCESMLCETIPIVSSVNNLPEIIGDTGFVVKKKDINLLIDIVNEALLLENKQELGKKARERIISNYSIDERARLLRETIESL